SAHQTPHPPRARGPCSASNAAGDTALTIGPADSWDDVCARLPADWRPDFVTLWLPYTSIPACLWSAPVPVVGLAGDWNLLWHRLRRCRCDLLLTDPTGVERLAAAGQTDARSANLYGPGAAFLNSSDSPAERDLDALFVGTLPPPVPPQPPPWLARLARLAGRRRVLIATGVFGDAYRALLARARIVFNRSIRGECNQRAFEAAAAGALLFQEAGNRDVPTYFADRREYVAYGDDDLDDLLDYYLDHEDERRRLADAARRKVATYGFDALWQRSLDEAVGPAWDALEGRGGERGAAAGPVPVAERVWQHLCATDGGDPRLAADLDAALAADPTSGELHGLAGLGLPPLLAQGNPPPAHALEKV